MTQEQFRIICYILGLTLPDPESAECLSGILKPYLKEFNSFKEMEKVTGIKVRKTIKEFMKKSADEDLSTANFLLIPEKRTAILFMSNGKKAKVLLWRNENEKR